jgi:uncharacterized protein (DUF849 family)
LFISGGAVLLKACLNGGTTRSAHPSVPQTPAELAADAAAVVAAGAGAVHLHPRDPAGAETLDAGCVLAAVAAVRAAAPATPVGVTTGLWAAGGDPARRMSEPHNFTAPRLHHGYGVATWPVLRAALRLGRDIRVGLEDTVVLEDGRLASGNRELVQAAARLAGEV